MKRIIFTHDFLVHSFSNNPTNHFWFVELFKNLILDSTKIEVLSLDKIGFSRDEFFKLSGIRNIASSYYNYDISKVTQESINYLKHFIDEDTLIIGVEIALDLRNILDKLGITFINFWFASYKLFDDIHFMINTNNLKIYEKLQNYKIPKEQFYFYANYWKIYIREQKLMNDNFLKDNSVLFAGQALIDKSIERNGEFLNILNFKDRLEQLSTQYDKIYYISHPSSCDNNDINKFINSTTYIEKISNIPTYYLLTSDKIKKVIGVSSSVLYEAQFFSKDVEYLYKSFFDIDSDFGLNTFINVYNDYFNPYFWSDILSPIINTDKNVLNKILFFNDKNMIRNIRDLYWGYSYLDSTKLYVNKINDMMRYPKFFIEILCYFIPSKKVRDKFRKKYSR